jgi:signal transduction histidine kinase
MPDTLPEEYERAYRRLRAWWSATPDLIVIIDKNGFYTEVVPGLEVKPKMPVKQIVGKHVLDIGDPTLAQKGWELAQKAMQTGEVQSLEYSHPTSPSVRLEARYAPCGDDECLVKIRDITDWTNNRQLLEERVNTRTAELQASNDELRQFAYAASHDLREPLGKIKAFGNRLQEKYGDRLDDKGFEYLNVMQNAADRMLLLIDDLLEYSRVGRKEHAQEWVNLDSVVAEVIDVFSERLTDANIEVGKLPVIWGDRHQMLILFQNLIGNSLKFRCPERPSRVRVSAINDGTCHVITVEDNGIGFDPEYAERIFQIFERLHTRFNYPGTGIGLALCRKIVDRHGGSIRGIGRPGEGATFELRLPKEKSNAC